MPLRDTEDLFYSCISELKAIVNQCKCKSKLVDDLDLLITSIEYFYSNNKCYHSLSLVEFNQGLRSLIKQIIQLACGNYDKESYNLILELCCKINISAVSAIRVVMRETYSDLPITFTPPNSPASPIAPLSFKRQRRPTPHPNAFLDIDRRSKSQATKFIITSQGTDTPVVTYFLEPDLRFNIASTAEEEAMFVPKVRLVTM